MEIEKQEEYEIRQAIFSKIKNRTNSYLDEYYEKYNELVGYILYYPLILLEKRYSTAIEPILANDHRYVISWFLKEMIKRGIKPREYEFNIQEYEKFEKTEYEIIYKLYNDYSNALKIINMKSVEKIKLTKDDTKTYRLHKPTIDDPYFKGLIHYFGTHDEQGMQNEQEIVKNYITYMTNKYKTFNITKRRIDKGILRELDYLDINIDNEFLRKSYERVQIDINKISSNGLKSDIIESIDEVKRIYGYFLYISNIQLYKASALICTNVKYYEKYIIEYDKEWIIKKINKVTGVDIGNIKKYISYLTLMSEYKGLLTEFPIIDLGKTIIFIPSNFILNDLQFSIVNGHYYKSVLFTDRENTVSASVVEKIYEKVKNLKNLVATKNQNYSSSKFGVNGEIDVAILDEKSSKLLIIECKWKENVFVGADNYKEIEDSINKIYKNQLDKNKLFLEDDINNIKSLFKDVKEVAISEENLEIMYIVVDKRVQYHYQDKHILSEFIILQILEENINNQILDINNIFEQVKNMQTKVYYEEQPTEMEFEIDNLKIYNSIFLGEY